MNNQQTLKIPEDDQNEYSLYTMFHDFYNRKMLSTIILIWTWGIIFMAAALYAAIKFFQTYETRCQIMYAAVFICLMQFLATMKIFAWQMIHRNSIKREIKKLRADIAELNRTVK